MSNDPSVLFRDWELLNEQVVPALREAEETGGQARVWAAGEVADAVAVSAAYQCGRDPQPAALRAFASGSPGPVYFSRAQIRALPPGDRSGLFRRCPLGWEVDERISRTILLAEPSRPVDLVLLREAGRGRDEMTRAADLLRPGGRLMLVDPDGRDVQEKGLRPLRADGRLYEKVATPGGRGRQPGGPGEDVDGLTLADRQIQADLVTSHANLARSLARRFSGHGESRQDLDQVALLALVKAAGRYDRDRNISFSTFATATILGELKRHFRDKTWMMRVPRSVQETYLAIKDARESLSHELSCSPTIQQIAERIGITEEMVLEAMEAGENYWPESLDVGIREGDAGRDVPVVDHSFDLVLEQRDLQLLMPRLAPRERVLLRRLYFDGWTQRQVAEEIGVSQMHISRLLSRTIDKLRMWASDQRFAGSY